MSCWSDEGYWRKLFPQLTIISVTDGDDISSSSSYPPLYEHGYGQRDRDELLNRLKDDGYALLDSPCDVNLREAVCTAVSDLERRHNLPATFALLFDETWRLAAESHQLLLKNEDKGILKSHGKMRFNFDMLAWHIDPREKQAGFSPHRDRQPDPDALKQSFYPDGQAKYITHWIALADANPNNSCLCKYFDRLHVMS